MQSAEPPLGAIHGAKVALPLVPRQGRGGIILIASVESRRAIPLQSACAACRHGVDGFAKVLRMELRLDRVPISVTSILPGAIDTPLFEKARTKIGVEPKGPAPVYRSGKVARDPRGGGDAAAGDRRRRSGEDDDLDGPVPDPGVDGFTRVRGVQKQNA